MAASEKKEAAKKLQKSYFDVLGLCCSSEVPLIEKILKSLDGIKDVSVIVPSKTVIVVHDNLIISQLQIVKALNKARLEANVRVYGERSYKKKWPSPYAIFCGILLGLSFLKFVYRPLQWLAIGSVAIGICPILMRGAASIRNLTLDINILVIVAVVGSIALHDYWEAGSIVFLFTIAEWLESRASHKATAVMSSLVNIVPQRAVLAETGEEIDANVVQVNTILAVKAGETIPIDGIVVEGKCEVDEKTLTGESFPVAKQEESTVWAGTLNLNGYISVRTTTLVEDCVVARMARLVEESQNSKSKTQRFIDKCAKFYTPAIVVISFCLVVIPIALRLRHRKQWYHLALVVLVSGCPCALILSTPVATFCALSRAATSGLLIKGGEYLENLAKIKIVAFDKTGTITRGEFTVTDFRSLLDDVSLMTLLYWVSSIESKSSHPMAAALVEYAQSHSADPKPDKVEEFENFPGEGIYGKIDGKDIYVGNRKIAMRAGCETVPTLRGDDMEGKSIGYVFSGGTPAGIFSLSDTCRTGVKEAIQELKSMGIQTAMLTGDSHAAAMHAQNQLGNALDIVHSELLPVGKARIIKDFQQEGPTAMIGDGLNDAPALATADIGISMGISGSALATETANVILMSNDIRKIPKAVRLARKARQKVIENMIFSITSKAAILALAFAGYPLVWAAVLADVGTSLLVIFNSMLLLRGLHKHKTKCCKSSASPHVHKHHKSANGRHSSHSHGHCCSDNEAQSLCEAQKCNPQRGYLKDHSGHAHSGKCGNNKYSGSLETHTCCANGDQLHKAKHADHERHDMDSQEKGLCSVCNEDYLDHFMSRSCGEDNCKNVVERQSVCVSCDGVHKAEYCDHGNCNMKTHHNHLDASSLELRRHIMSDSHCHLVDCKHKNVREHTTVEELGHSVETSCKHVKFKKLGADSGTPLHSRECIAAKACMNLEKRHIGGCCKSYRKECCGRSGHFGANLGGLSEIIIE